MALPRVLKAVTLRAYKRSGLAGSVRLSFTDCLGPCSESNVVFLYLHGRPLWFRRINSPETLTALLEYVRTALDDPGCPVPPHLEPHSFCWTGGGLGPAPPVPDTPVHGAVEAAR
jgi:(2Fe-2S) ferredoxin